MRDGRGVTNLRTTYSPRQGRLDGNEKSNNMVLCGIGGVKFRYYKIRHASNRANPDHAHCFHSWKRSTNVLFLGH